MLTICCYFCAEAETQADVYTETGLLKTERIAKMLNRREFQNLLALLGPEDRGGCCGCRWMDFSGKLPCCERSSPGSTVSTNPHEWLMHGIVQWHGLSNSPALSLCKGKVSWLLTLSWWTQLTRPGRLYFCLCWEQRDRSLHCSWSALTQQIQCWGAGKRRICEWSRLWKRQPHKVGPANHLC